METVEVEPVGFDEDVNIYGDICDFDLGEEIEKLRAENKKLEDHIAELNGNIDKLNGTIGELKDTQNNLTRNISSLFKTAKSEVERKNRMIEELREQVDSRRINRFNPDIMNKRKDRENSPLEANKPKKFKYDDNPTRNEIVDSDNQETKSEGKQEPRPKRSDSYRYPEDDNRYGHKSNHSNDRYDDQYGRNRYDFRAKRLNERYNDNDRFDSRNKYYNDRYSNYEDDGYCSRSKYSSDRTERYNNENEGRYDSRSQYFGERYNSRANSYANSERDEGDRDYQNSYWNWKNNVEDGRGGDRDDYKYESERHSRYAGRRSVDQRDSRYLRSERNRSLERETRFEASHPRLGTPPFEQDQETRRSITPMPLPEDIEVPKPKPPKKRLKMLEEMEKKVKQSRLSQAGSGLNNESERTVEKNKQNDVRNRSNSTAYQSTGRDSDRNSIASSRSTKSDKGDVGSHGKMHRKEEAKLNKEKTPSKMAVTNEKFKPRNSDVSKKVVQQSQEIESKSVKTKNVNATGRDRKQSVSEGKSVNDSQRISDEKKVHAIAESIATNVNKVVLNISKGATNITEQNTDIQERSVKNVRNEVVKNTVKNASETLKAESHKQTQQKECKEASKRSTEETAKQETTKVATEKDRKNEKISTSGKQSEGKVDRREELNNDALKNTNKGLITKEENLVEQHAQRSEQDVKPVRKEVTKARRKSMSVEQVVDNIKNKIAELKEDSTEKFEGKKRKFSTETNEKLSQNNKAQTEETIDSEMKRSKPISNAPGQDEDKDIKTDLKTIKKDVKINSEGDIQKQTKKETESSKKVVKNKTIATEKKDSADLKSVEHEQSCNTKKPEANVTVDKDKTTTNLNENKQRNCGNQVEAGISKEQKEKKGLKEDFKKDAIENVHAEIQEKAKNFEEQQLDLAENDTKSKRRKSTSEESGVDNYKNKMKKSDKSTKQDKSIESKKVSTATGGKQSQISKEEKSEQKLASENVSNVPKRDTETVVDIKTNKRTAKKVIEAHSGRAVHKHPEKEAMKDKIFDDATEGTDEQDVLKRASIEHKQSSNVTKSEAVVTSDKVKAKTNANQNEQKTRVSEVKRRIRFSKEEKVDGMDHKVESKLDGQNVTNEAMTERNSKHDKISEVKQMALKNFEDCKKVVGEPVNDDLKGKNSIQESVHPNNKQGNSTNITSIAEDGNKNDTKSKEAHSSKTQETSTESPNTSSEEESLKRVTKNKNVMNVLSTSSSADSGSVSEESSDDILSLNKTIPKLIEIKDVQQKSVRTVKRVASLSDSSTSDDMIVTPKPDSMKLVEKKFDNLLKNYIENFKGDSPENEKKATEPKIKVLEVINIVNAQGKLEIRTMRHKENSIAGSSIDSASTEKSSAIAGSPATQINTPNSVRPTRRRITPTPVKDDKPLCTFENILTKTCQSKAFPTTKQTMESPLHLTHEGEIPVLHLEENHINDLPTEMNINDKNIISLLDTMNISNIDCDIPKFKSVSGESTVNSGVSGGGDDNNGLTFENIMEKVTSTPVRTQEAEGSVDETQTSTVDCSVSISETPNSTVTNCVSTSTLSSDKTVNSNVQSGTKSTPFRRRRRCWMVISDK